MSREIKDGLSEIGAALKSAGSDIGCGLMMVAVALLMATCVAIR